MTRDAMMLSRCKAQLRRGYMRILRPYPDGLADEMLRAGQTWLPKGTRENVCDGKLVSIGTKLLHSRQLPDFNVVVCLSPHLLLGVHALQLIGAHAICSA